MNVTAASTATQLSNRIDTGSRWMRLVVGLVAIFVLLQGSAQLLGSTRGEAGVIVGVLVVAATLAVERKIFGRAFVPAARLLGLGRPDALGLCLAGGICLALLLAIPVFLRLAQTSVVFLPGWLSLLPGLFAQGGVAEEVLFRGYLYGHLRVGRTFRQAAWLSMLPFVGVHLLLFFTMPWPIALAALLLATLLSFPLAQLFELGGATIWPAALVHFVVQGTVKVIAFPDAAGTSFPLVWMAASALLPMFVLLIPRRQIVVGLSGRQASAPGLQRR